ncbi:testis-specific Y-encoded-like protein 4 [Caloenas nicobarica]|uniref:testis-specific Y-encoded-like protein 4 n=1 Tax=Caloenas nicobarica TaxID=187106 RepID=UPI0032B74FFF
MGSMETTSEITGSLETTNRPKGSLETTTSQCLEQGKGGLKSTREVMGSLETTSEITGSLETTNRPKGSLETTTSQCLEQGKGGLESTSEVTGSLETANRRKGSLETAVTCCLKQRRSKGGLETTSAVMGSLETANGCKGSLETTVTGCLEQGRRSNRGLETDASVSGGLKTTSRRKGGLKTTTRPKGSVETAVTHCLEQGRSGKGGLETTREVMGSLETTIAQSSEQGRRTKRGLETSREVTGGLEPTNGHTGSLETAITRCLARRRSGKGSLETASEPKEGLETTSTAQSEQNQGGKQVPEAKEGLSCSLEECAVISLGEEEDEEEEEEEGAGRYLAALEAVQLELEAVQEQAARAFRRLRNKFWLRRQPHLQRRNRLIQHIPGFWVTTFLNHPQLSAMISDRDEDALSYMTNLQVEEFGQARSGCRIRFFFSVNPYFQNDVVAKEFVRGPSGHLVSHSTPIRWWQGQDPRSRPHKGPPTPRSFFSWFGDHSFPAGDRIAEIIKEELWPNPLQFYLLGDSAEGTPESESGEDSVVIVDDDEDVQETPDDGDGIEVVQTEEPSSPPSGRH